ncbi:MAG: hypothetical protein ONB44_18695 [candidate division KSB1 bacterium]|nr:hypothetical protein [candidate division KSB1 bacterium]MDZ7304159.1 hypothetical protein [candidate division KSB1 bacterium]MDZ7310632.1 hypothetical protein [candidate division KSB1 bacterium]
MVSLDFFHSYFARHQQMQHGFEQRLQGRFALFFRLDFLVHHREQAGDFGTCPEGTW